MSDNKYFYDIHCHAMNFSHPNLFAFLKRKWTIALLASPLAPIAAVLSKDKVKKVSNLFSLMENDIADFFLIMEYYLKDGVKRLPLVIGDTTYDKIILTPLMMDFGCKGIINDSFYGIAPQKPIVEQVVDVFNGIKKYCQNELLVKNGEVEYIPPKKDEKLFEIYPFLGINTKNYTHGQIQNLLAKYFSDYNHDRQNLYDNMGKFNGDINAIGSNFFAGIKVYPPLDFDPWPEGNDNELAKVKCLYRYCNEKKIPITTHCSEGGFATVDEAKEYTSPAKWKPVLSEFKDLRLNFAHFGRQDRKWYGADNHEWENEILSLILSHENVYADFSYRGCDDSYYDDLKELVNNQAGGNKDKLKAKILFGSDFMINLMDIDSYNQYLERFMVSSNPLSVDDKKLFCSNNPENFLFGA